MLQEVLGPRSGEPQFAHVTHVEQADGRPNGLVLLAQSRILDGHLVARKGDHFGPCGHMQWIQRGTNQGNSRSFHRPKVGGLPAPVPKGILRFIPPFAPV